jgi:uncharacterized protein YndB with AHSA1/START domain
MTVARQPDHATGGDPGLRRTAAVLGQLADRPDHDVIHDLWVPRSRMHADHLLVGPSGVFMIETAVHRGIVRRFDGTLWVGTHSMRTEFEAVRFGTARLSEHLGVQVMGIVCFAEGELEHPIQFVDGIDVVALDALIEVLTVDRPGLALANRPAIVARAGQLAIRHGGPQRPPIAVGLVAPVIDPAGATRSARREVGPRRGTMASMPSDLTVTRDIAAAPDALFALITDLPRMGEWSPENEGGKWIRGATAAAPGAKFQGSNRNGKRVWTTTCTVVECTSPSTFSFEVTVGPVKVAHWSYSIAANGSGSTVTEKWHDQRNWLAKKFSGPASGVADRVAHNRAGMEETLRKLAEAVEQ